MIILMLLFRKEWRILISIVISVVYYKKKNIMFSENTGAMKFSFSCKLAWKYFFLSTFKSITLIEIFLWCILFFYWGNRQDFFFFFMYKKKKNKLKWCNYFFIIKVFRTIVFIFIVISTTFSPICPPAFFRCLSNSGTFTELQWRQ